MKKRWYRLVPAALCLMLSLSACGKEDENTEFTGDTTQELPYQSNLNAITPAAYNNVKGLELEPGTFISVIGKDNSSSYWSEVKRGVQQAADDLNEELGYTGEEKIKVTYNAPAGSEDIDEQVNILDEELARYPDALVISSIGAEACHVQFDLATENGIPIIAMDSANSHQGVQSTVTTNNEEAGKTCAHKMMDELAETGKVLVLVHDSDSGSAMEREGSFRTVIAEEAPGMTLTETIYLNTIEDTKALIAEEQNAQKAENEEAVVADNITDEDVIAYYLEKDPQITGVYATNLYTTQLAVRGIEKAGKTETVLIGFDAGKEQVENLKAGKIQGLVVQNPFGMGYASVIAAARTVLQSGNEAVVDTGYVWVTEDNLEEPSIKPLLYK